MKFVPHLRATLLAIAISIYPTIAPASVLERVLQLLDAAYPHVKAANISANIAENIASPTRQNRSLASGDRVVIGYDLSGMAVLGTADAFGLLVTPAQAASLGTGVSAGLYPVGSALYALPPAGQLSVFDQSAGGDILTRAQQTMLTQIDGSITNVITVTFPEIAADLAAFETNLDARSIGINALGTTALGAVNAGEIVTNVQVLTGMDALDVSGMALAQLAKGPNVALDHAVTDQTSAMIQRVSQIGGDVNQTFMALNIASNNSAVTGRVTNVIRGLGGEISETVTTTIGAVNGGRISP